MAALCALSAVRALAQFTNVEQSPWQGGTFHYYGNTWVTSGNLTNSGPMIYNTSILPATTGSLAGSGGNQSGDYYIGVGVLVDGSDGVTINNNSGGLMQGIVTGSGKAYASGIWSLQLVNVNNSGVCNGQVLNCDGAAYGVYADSSGANITNQAGATMSATAQWLAQGIQAGQTANVVNNGTITATVTGGQQGTTTNAASLSGVGLFSYSTDGGAPLYLENNGLIIANATSGSATNNGAGVSEWGEGSSVILINNGIIAETNASSQGDINGVYFGADNFFADNGDAGGDVTFVNTGTVSKNGPGTWGVELENDSPGGVMRFFNSGTITANPGYAVGINNYEAGPYNPCYVTNTGTITGNPCALELLWGGDTTVVDSGDLHGWFWLGSGNNTVYINGLPTIDNSISGGSGSNTLVFNLTGALQQVNGNAASGTNLSVFNLGPLGSGSIVVSGKTYGWSNFTNVFGAITPATTLLAGPTNLTATVASISQANLAWHAVTNAASYNVKRSLTSDGPYTTIASGITTTNYADPAAFVGIEYYYVVSAMVGGVETANSVEVALRHPRLTGAIIGTPGSWGNSGNTITNVFDNNLTTFFDAPDPGNGDWVGLYFGASVSNAITLINYCPRAGFESRMVGGIFQGANQSNFSDAVTLYTVASQPATGVFTSVSPTNTSAFRYVRYLSPNGGYGNVAELQFYGSLAGASVPLPLAPGGLAAAAVSSSQINLAWNAVTNATSYMVERSLTNGGPYAVITSGATGTTNYYDSGLAAGTTCYYVVSAANAGGESTNSVQVSATTMFMPPSGLTATAVSGSQVSLTWNPVPNATSYNIKRSLTNGGPYAVIASGVTATNYLDGGLIGGAVYYYVVSVMVGGGESSSNSLQVAAATLLSNYGSLIHRYSFLETGGTNTADSVGGAMCMAALPDGGALSGGQLALSSGSSQYVSLPTGIVGALTNFTVMAWVNLATTANWARIFDFGDNTTTYMFLTPQCGGSGTLRFAVTTNSSGSEQQINCSLTLNTGAWHQVAVTLNTNRGILYLDGVAVGTNTGMTLNPAILGITTNNYLGKSQWADPYFNGWFAEFRIYNVGLSAAEIAATAALGSGGLLSAGSPPMSLARTGMNLTFSWPLANAGFTLQSRTNLSSGAWMNTAMPAPQIIAGQWLVTLPPATNAGPVFYRLMK